MHPSVKCCYVVFCAGRVHRYTKATWVKHGETQKTRSSPTRITHKDPVQYNTLTKITLPVRAPASAHLLSFGGHERPPWHPPTQPPIDPKRSSAAWELETFLRLSESPTPTSALRVPGLHEKQPLGACRGDEVPAVLRRQRVLWPRGVVRNEETPGSRVI